MRNGGFSLVEILIALAIGAFLLTSLWLSFMTASFNANSAKHYGQAMDVCEARLEELKSLRIVDIEGMLNNVVEEELAFDSAYDGSSAIACTRTTRITDEDGDNVYEVLVNTVWNERYLGADRNNTVTLYGQIAKVNF